MYDTQEIANRIKARSRQQGITLRDLLAKLDMGINTVSHLAKGQELSCSVDYLLGRTDDSQLHGLDAISQPEK